MCCSLERLDICSICRPVFLLLSLPCSFPIYSGSSNVFMSVAIDVVVSLFSCLRKNRLDSGQFRARPYGSHFCAPSSSRKKTSKDAGRSEAPEDAERAGRSEDSRRRRKTFSSCLVIVWPNSNRDRSGLEKPGPLSIPRSAQAADTPSAACATCWRQMRGRSA